jgi:hypothetical protein
LFFFSSMGFELRALHLFSKYSTIWAMFPALFSFRLFFRSSHTFLTRLALDYDPPTYAGIIGLCHHAQLICWHGGLTNFLPGLDWNHDPPVSSLLLQSSWNYRCESPHLVYHLSNKHFSLKTWGFVCVCVCVCVCVVPGLELRAYTLSHSTSPFCVRYFQDRVSQTIFLGWLWTAIPLISASWVSRIKGVSHWCPANMRSWDRHGNTFWLLYFLKCSQHSQVICNIIFSLFFFGSIWLWTQGLVLS